MDKKDACFYSFRGYTHAWWEVDGLVQASSLRDRGDSVLSPEIWEIRTPFCLNDFSRSADSFAATPSSIDERQTSHGKCCPIFFHRRT